jgi:hypothetical protein
MWVIKQNKNMKKKFCVLQKKVQSFGPNRSVEVRPNGSAEPNVWSVTSIEWSHVEILAGFGPTFMAAQ